MDYQACWEDLRYELLVLSKRGVRTIDPEIVLAYMRYIEEREAHSNILPKS